MEANQRIISALEQMYQLRVNQKQTYRADAYLKAANAIKQYPYPITSGKAIKTLPGIGVKMVQNIDEILATGTLKELAAAGPIVIPLSEKEQAYEDLKVYGAGPKTIEKWYNLGYRKAAEVPMSLRTNEQNLGVFYKEELDQRIPRAEMDEFNELFMQILIELGTQGLICGSYRRGRVNSGDVDLLMLDIPGYHLDLMKEIVKYPVFTYILSAGNKKIKAIGKIKELHRRIDVELVQPEELAFAMLYFTGPDSFNKKMREHCKSMNLKLNEKSLTERVPKSLKNKTKTVFYLAFSEEEVFELLGLQYLTPEERDKY